VLYPEAKKKNILVAEQFVLFEKILLEIFSRKQIDNADMSNKNFVEKHFTLEIQGFLRKNNLLRLMRCLI